MFQEQQTEVFFPDPPQSPNNKGYYLIYGTWTQLIQQSPIATMENPNPTAQILQRSLSLNECIEVSPVIYLLAMQKYRPGYAITFAMSISKEMFNWYKECERVMNEAVKKQDESVEEPSTIQ